MIHKSFTIEGPPDIEIRIETGRVDIRPGEPGTVDVRVDTKVAGFIVEQRGNSILVSSDKNASWLSRGSAYIVIEAPDGTDIKAGVASAPIRAEIPLGKVDIRTASGDIELMAAETLVVKTASGDLDVGSVERGLRFSSASGDLRVADRAGGSVVASTASGDVHIEHSDATIEMNTASGDAHISYFEGRSASFKAMSGDIDIGVPPRTNVDLEVSLLSGRLRLPDSPKRDEPPERHMSIRGKLVSGDFTLTLLDG